MTKNRVIRGLYTVKYNRDGELLSYAVVARDRDEAAKIVKDVFPSAKVSDVSRERMVLA